MAPVLSFVSRGVSPEEVQHSPAAVGDSPARSGNPPHDQDPYDAMRSRAMTVPEENRPKTDTTDEVLEHREDREDDASRQAGATGRTMREALEEAQVRPDDYDE
jgi:hypothetical protein